ncbi:MAG: helix-turn-helix domain-containing protein [Candidatus Eremiobacteraeota bacterium]|nr:helix-turn-helix domain-containing protein [Candidatus Eremiobacteraeota bacterium]
MEVTLKEAATLCKKSEKTLRRKIEAGLLDGRKEPLEFGGFMWMIDVASLDELYPGSRPSNLPQVYDAPEPPQVRLKNRPEDETSKEVRAVVHREPDYDEEDDDEDGEEWNARQSFFDYILDENRNLKYELKDREAHILALNERTFALERALGEQEGTSTTQARVLEWFQSQEAIREQSRQETEQKLLNAAPEEVKKVGFPWSAALAGAGVMMLFTLILISTGILSPV